MSNIVQIITNGRDGHQLEIHLLTAEQLEKLNYQCYERDLKYVIVWNKDTKLFSWLRHLDRQVSIPGKYSAFGLSKENLNGLHCQITETEKDMSAIRCPCDSCTRPVVKEKRFCLIETKEDDDL